MAERTESDNWWDGQDPEPAPTSDPTPESNTDPGLLAPIPGSGAVTPEFTSGLNALYQKYYGRDASGSELEAHWGNPGGLGAIETMLMASQANPANELPTPGAPQVPVDPPINPPTTTTPQPPTTTTPPPANQPASSPLTGGGTGSVSSGGSQAGSPNLGSIFDQMNAEAARHGTGAGAPTGVSGDLYNTLLARAHQGTQVSGDDPNIRQQVDPYSAQVERERRNYLSEVAEKRGPMGSIEGERRLSAERAGQATGLFQSQLIGREIQSRRDEIAQALAQLGSQMSTDQQQALSKEMNYLNSSLQKYGIDSGANTALTGIFTNAGLDQQKINSNNDQFAQTFGLNSTNQANYWDAIRRGLIKG